MDPSGKSKGITFSENGPMTETPGSKKNIKPKRVTNSEDQKELRASIWTQPTIDYVLRSLSVLSSDMDYIHRETRTDDSFLSDVRSFISAHPMLDPFDSKSLFVTMHRNNSPESVDLAKHMNLKNYLEKDEKSDLSPLNLQDIDKFKELFQSCWNGQIGDQRANPWILQVHNEINFTCFLESMDQETISPMITTLDGLFDYMTVTPKRPQYIISKTDCMSEALNRKKRDWSIEPFFGRDLLDSLLWVYLSPEQRQFVSQRHFIYCSDFVIHWRSFVLTQMQIKSLNQLVLITLTNNNKKHMMALFNNNGKYYLVHHEDSLSDEFKVNDLESYYVPLSGDTIAPSDYVYELIALMYCHMHLIQGWGLNIGGKIQVVIPRSIITKSTDIMSHMWLAFVTHAGSYHNMDKPIRLMFDLSYYYRIHQTNYDAYYADLHGVHKVPFETFVNNAEQDDVTQKIMDHHAHKISILFKDPPYPYIVKDEPQIVPGNSCLAILMYLILKTDEETLLSWIPQE